MKIYKTQAEVEVKVDGKVYKAVINKLKERA